jgi:phospholipid/cholesterol/gamma-HCH transport system substrate-binding protein
MKNTLETRLGIFFALVFLAAVFIVEILGGLEFIKGGTRLRARFNNIQDLKAGDAVKMAGVQIGRVETIELAENQVEVVLKVNRKARVKTDSKAAVKFMGLMGQNYVAIDFGTATAPTVSEGDVLTTVEQPDLSMLMTKLEGVASSVEGLSKSFSSDNLSTLMGPFTDFFKDKKDQLGAIIGNVQTISSQIASSQGTMGMLINDKTLYTSALETVTNLNSTAGDVKEMVAQAKGMVAQINAGQGSLGKLVKDEKLYSETTEAMTNLKEVLQKVNQGQGTVGKLVNDDNMLKNMKLTLQKLDKATEGLEDQGPLSVIGIIAGKLF